MIVSKKVLIAAATIPIIITLVIAIPKISPGSDQTATTGTSLQVRIQFANETMKRVSFGVTENVGAQRSETLIIENDGTAFYSVNAEGEKGSQTRFKVNNDDLKRVKALIVETGFMQIPKEQFAPRDDITQFIRYTLTVDLNGNTKTIQWVDEPSAKDFAPALLANLADTMGRIIQIHK